MDFSELLASLTDKDTADPRTRTPEKLGYLQIDSYLTLETCVWKHEYQSSAAERVPPKCEAGRGTLLSSKAGVKAAAFKDHASTFTTDLLKISPRPGTPRPLWSHHLDKRGELGTLLNKEGYVNFMLIRCIHTALL